VLRRNTYRTTSAECRERERLDADMYNDVRKASEVHRAVRKYIKKIAVPGVKLIDLCETLEDSVRKLIEEKGLQARKRRVSINSSTPRLRVGCELCMLLGCDCLLRSVGTGGLT
jgi:hypothetical protein